MTNEQTRIADLMAEHEADKAEASRQYKAEAYANRLAEAKVALMGIQMHLEEAVNRNTDDVDWGVISDMGRIGGDLKNIDDYIHGKGEYAS